MIDKTIFERICRRIDRYESQMVDLQIRLTAIPALAPESGGNGEYEKACFLRDYLKEAGFPTVREINAPDGRVDSGVRPNLIVPLAGAKEGPAVWILTHLDIVPPGELKFWTRDPYQGHAEEGKVYGRGTEDNQQDLVASLFAAKAFLDEGITPPHAIGLAFVADEETGSQWGLTHILRSDENPFLKRDLLLVPDSGDTEGSLIEVAEKSVLWLRFLTTGKQCHGSQPALGKNAFLAASHLVVRLNDLHRRFDVEDPLFDPPESTFQPTRKDANVPNVNTIPGEDVFYLDGRVLPRYPLPEVMAVIREMADEIEKRFGVTIEVTPVQYIQSPPPTPLDAPVVRALTAAIRDVYGIEARPRGIGAGTVAAHFRQDGYPVAVWSRVTHMAHQPDEYGLIRNMMGNAKVYAHLFLQGAS